MLQGERSAILSTFIKLPFSIKTFVLSFLSGHLRQVSLYLRFNFFHILLIMLLFIFFIHFVAKFLPILTKGFSLKYPDKTLPDLLLVPFSNRLVHTVDHFSCVH